MGLMDQAVSDAAQIISDTDGFARAVLFTTPGGSLSVSMKGLVINHSTTLNEFGAPVRGKTARVTVAENLFPEDYPVRTDNLIALKDHRVSWPDSAGLTYYGQINEILPDRSFGLIRCIVGDYRTGSEPNRIIGYKPARIFANLVDTPDPDQTQTLDNGDIIPLEYTPNVDNTLTIPYCIGLSVLSTFMVDNSQVTIAFVKSTGTFSYGSNGLYVPQKIQFDMAIPIYLV